MSDVKILVMGCGSIGRRHIRLLCEMGVEVEACDVDDAAAERASKELGVLVHIDPDIGILAQFFDGAIIATPPHVHAGPAVLALREGLPIFIEKPLAATLEQATRIIDAANDTPVLVGYCLRRHAGLQRVKTLIEEGAIGRPLCARMWCGSYLPDWRPGTDYRHGYAAKRHQGGGVLLDISHEIDYACWLLGEPESVQCTLQTSGALEIETEDVADVLMTFRGGAQANIHLDYLDRSRDRGCVVAGDKGSLRWDGWDTRSVGALLQTAVGAEWKRGHASPKPWEPDDMYRAELQHFLAVVRGEATPVCTAQDGLLALRIADAAQRSHATGQRVTL